jgi:hypothetical protein
MDVELEGFLVGLYRSGRDHDAVLENHKPNGVDGSCQLTPAPAAPGCSVRRPGSAGVVS